MHEHNHGDDVTKEVVSKIKLTPAEKAVLMEQAETLKVEVDRFQRAVADNNGTMLNGAWESMGEAMTFIGMLVNMKGMAAARQLVIEQTD